MKITFDPAKRAATLAGRGLDFEDAAEVFRGDTLDSPDDRARLWRVTHRHGRTSSGAHVDRNLDTERKRAACYLDEESKCPRKSALWAAI